MPKNLYTAYFKRLFDFGASLFGIILLSPLFIILTVILWIDFKGSPFFLHERPGKDEKTFRVIKFRSMNNKKDANGNLLSNRIRTTRMGRFIRKYSLDEIPQLLNVIKGDMSLIGPRPLELQYLPYYNKTERKRHLVRPGITGQAQLKGRNSLIWEERFLLDVDYVENVSLKLDLKILYRTVLKLLSKSDVAIDQGDFMDIFDVYRKKQWEAANAS